MLVRDVHILWGRKFIMNRERADIDRFWMLTRFSSAPTPLEQNATNRISARARSMVTGEEQIEDIFHTEMP